MWYPPDHVAFNNLSPALFTGGSCVRNGTRQASDAGQAQCPRWVIHVIANSRRNPPLSVVGPIGDKTRCNRFVREVPIAAKAGVRAQTTPEDATRLV